MKAGERPFPDHFSRTASGYRASRPCYPLDLVEWLAGLSVEHSLAWDAGCGSGQLSVSLTGHFECVVASDASPRQIAEAPRHPRVRYRVARAEASGLPAGVVDLTVAAQAVHWFHLEAYYAEVERVTRGGAGVALVCYRRPELPGEANEVLLRFHRDLLGPCWPPERRLVEEGYRSLPFPFEEVRAPELTMTHRWDLARFAAYVETWSAVRILTRRRGRGPLREFLQELGAAWGDPAGPHEIRWPVAVRAGRVRR